MDRNSGSNRGCGASKRAQYVEYERLTFTCRDRGRKNAQSRVSYPHFENEHACIPNTYFETQGNLWTLDEPTTLGAIIEIKGRKYNYNVVECENDVFAQLVINQLIIYVQSCTYVETRESLIMICSMFDFITRPKQKVRSHFFPTTVDWASPHFLGES